MSEAMQEALTMANSAAAEPDDSEQSTETPAVEQETSQEVTAEQQPTIHPAMQELLDKIPEAFRPAVATPLQEWQRSADENLRRVHSEYEAFKPLKERGVAVEDLQAGAALVEALRNNPRAVYDQMQAYYRFAQEQGQEDSADESQYDDPQEEVDPRLLQLQQSQQQIEQMLQKQQFDQEVAQATAEIDTVLASVKETHGLGEAAERFVVKEAMGLLDQYPNEPIQKIFDAAVSTYQQFAGEIAPKNTGPKAPVVPRGSSSVPSTVVNPADLDEKGRKTAALEMARLFSQNGS